METTNEEQQATNQKLLASNEELQSTNEELQSVNEELYSVNAEFQSKIGELTGLNNDIDNLLHNTDIGTVFLDGKLCIRKFTPAVTSVIKLLEHDIGRPLDQISYGIKTTWNRSATSGANSNSLRTWDCQAAFGRRKSRSGF